MDSEINFGMLQVVIELNPNEPKVCADNNFDEREYQDHKVIILLTESSWTNHKCVCEVNFFIIFVRLRRKS